MPNDSPVAYLEPPFRVKLPILEDEVWVPTPCLADEPISEIGEWWPPTAVGDGEVTAGRTGPTLCGCNWYEAGHRVNIEPVGKGHTWWVSMVPTGNPLSDAPHSMMLLVNSVS